MFLTVYQAKIHSSCTGRVHLYLFISLIIMRSPFQYHHAILQSWLGFYPSFTVPRLRKPPRNTYGCQIDRSSFIHNYSQNGCKSFTTISKVLIFELIFWV
jgi:hypothetical protein